VRSRWTSGRSLPGRWASFENYTSYSGGLNGILLDLTGVTGAVTAGDFSFRVGDGSPGGWSALAVVPTVSMRVVSGMTRVTLIWPDEAIRTGGWR